MFSLYPGDLHPFTRKPFFVIVDSDNSFVFQNIPRYFGQPMVILMSPQDVPPNFQGKKKKYITLQLWFLIIVILRIFDIYKSTISVSESAILLYHRGEIKKPKKNYQWYQEYKFNMISLDILYGCTFSTQSS